MSSERRAIGPCNILTVHEAVRELGIRHMDAVRWLEARKLIHMVAGRRRVIAGDLIEAIRSLTVDGPVESRKQVTRSLLDLPLAEI
jgi:hypothetical protein